VDSSALRGDTDFLIYEDEHWSFGEVVRQARDQVRLCVVLFVELLQVIERHFFDRRNRARTVVPVRRPAIESRVERLFTEFLVVIAAETDPQGVDGFILEALEIVLAPARFQKHRAEQLVVGVQVIHVRGADESGHLLIGLGRYGAGHGKHCVHDLFVGQVLGAPAGKHRRR